MRLDYTIKWSKHASKRWEERISTDKPSYLTELKRLTKKESAQLRDSCKFSWSKYIAGGFKSRYLRKYKNAALVIADDTVVTVLEIAS